MSIIDRKKNLVKLAGGEYIALERLESAYKGCELVANICVHADPNANRPMAIVFPHENNLANACQAHGIQTKGFESQCEDDKVTDLVLKDLNAVGKKAGFKPLEVSAAHGAAPETTS